MSGSSKWRRCAGDTLTVGVPLLIANSGGPSRVSLEEFGEEEGPVDCDDTFRDCRVEGEAISESIVDGENIEGGDDGTQSIRCLVAEMPAGKV